MKRKRLLNLIIDDPNFVSTNCIDSSNVFINFEEVSSHITIPYAKVIIYFPVMDLNKLRFVETYKLTNPESRIEVVLLFNRNKYRTMQLASLGIDKIHYFKIEELNYVSKQHPINLNFEGVQLLMIQNINKDGVFLREKYINSFQNDYIYNFKEFNNVRFKDNLDINYGKYLRLYKKIKDKLIKKSKILWFINEKSNINYKDFLEYDIQFVSKKNVFEKILGVNPDIVLFDFSIKNDNAMQLIKEKITDQFPHIIFVDITENFSVLELKLLANHSEKFRFEDYTLNYVFSKIKINLTCFDNKIVQFKCNKKLEHNAIIVVNNVFMKIYSIKKIKDLIYSAEIIENIDLYSKLNKLNKFNLKLIK